MTNFIPREARKISEKEDRPTYNFTEAPPGASLKISENGTYFIPFS